MNGSVATWPRGHVATQTPMNGPVTTWPCGHTNNVDMLKVAVGMMPRGCCNVAVLQHVLTGPQTVPKPGLPSCSMWTNF